MLRGDGSIRRRVLQSEQCYLVPTDAVLQSAKASFVFVRSEYHDRNRLSLRFRVVDQSQPGSVEARQVKIAHDGARAASEECVNHHAVVKLLDLVETSSHRKKRCRRHPA